MSTPDLPIDEREPSPQYVDGTLTERHYRAGPGVRGRPYVMVHRGDRARVVAGAGAAFGRGVVCLTGGNHRADWITTFALREVYGLPGAYVGNPISRGDIVVGDGAVVGEGTWIVSGVRIGAGAVVQPYSIVTRDVAPGAVVGGSPAAVIEEGRASADPTALPPGRPLRERLRSLAGRLHPPTTTWNDFPAQLSTYPDEVLDLGHASYDAPVIIGPPGGGHHLAIGPYCSLAWDAEVLLDPGEAPAEPGRVALGPQRAAAVAADHPGLRAELGADIWLARRAKVLGGVRVGHGAIIATGAVVTEDVRPYGIVAGNPAREVGRRFSDEQVEGLLDVAWWDWPEATVLERYLELCDPDVDGFIARYRGAGRG